MESEAWIKKGSLLFVVVCLLMHSRPSEAQVGGAWTDVIPLPVIPVSAALLPNRKVLIWSSSQAFGFPGDLGDAPSLTYTAIFDPATGRSVQITETKAHSDMFCAGIAYLSDGRVLVNGGDSSPKTSIYDYLTKTWSAGAYMNIPRGYNSDVLLTTGEVLTLGGSWSGFDEEKNGEVWSPTTGEWSLRSGILAQPITGPDPEGGYRGDTLLWLFAVANGYVLHAGPSAEMHWIETSGDGSIVSAGTRGDDAYSINGKAVLYDVGKILKTGGGPAFENAWATAATYVITFNPALADPRNQAVVVETTAPMAYPRAFANGVVLPNGQVLIVGGQAYAVPFTDDLAVLVPELWDPVDETFTQLAPMQTPRNYHSTALLLPDGRVFVGGGGLCGCGADHPDAEIFSPPYLFNLDGTPAVRPNIVSAPSTAQLGSTMSVTTNTPVTAFAILRLSATTHAVDNDQRRVPLQIISASQNSYALSVPGDPGVVSPGYYMLFAINPQGTPSVAAIIQFG
jgi:galactose oxidase